MPAPRGLRRRFIQGLGAAARGLLLPRMMWADSGGESRLVVIILRGALDGLAAVPPHADPAYAALHQDLAIAPPGGAAGALGLDNLFGLHPALAFLHERYLARELVVFHAIASPYRDRSHFDGQNVLENGSLQPHAVQTGWLNRGLASLQAGNGRDMGVALGQNFPLVMRGPASVTSWSPSTLAALDDDTLQRITDLSSGDPLLASRLADALSADAIASASTTSDSAN